MEESFLGHSEKEQIDILKKIEKSHPGIYEQFFDYVDYLNDIRRLNEDEVVAFLKEKEVTLTLIGVVMRVARVETVKNILSRIGKERRGKVLMVMQKPIPIKDINRALGILIGRVLIPGIRIGKYDIPLK